MGVDFSKERPPLSIACVAEISLIDKAKFAVFRKALLSHLTTHHHEDHHDRDHEDHEAEPTHEGEHEAPTRQAWRTPNLTSDALTHAVETSDLSQKDAYILERMFALMDRTGDDVIHALELLVGVAMLVKGSFQDKLELATDCLLEDLAGVPLEPTHLLFLVSTMTTAANYFGDPLVALPVLEGVANDAFVELQAAEVDATSANSSTAIARALAKHPIVQGYVESAA